MDRADVTELLEDPSLPEDVVASAYRDLARTQRFLGNTRAVLRLLRRDRLDLFLMHEATPDELRDEGLLAFLQGSVASGRIGAFGVGGDHGAAGAPSALPPPACPT